LQPVLFPKGKEAHVADLSAYARDMEYLKNAVLSGSLTSDNAIYRDLKSKTNLDDLQRWLAREIDPYVQQV
jgi:hypothetical protein